VEEHLQKDVAELVPDGGLVAGVDRVEQLVGLLQQMAGEGSMRLLVIPRAASGTAQDRHHLDRLDQALSPSGRRDRLGPDRLQGIVARPRGRGHGD